MGLVKKNSTKVSGKVNAFQNDKTFCLDTRASSPEAQIEKILKGWGAKHFSIFHF